MDMLNLISLLLLNFTFKYLTIADCLSINKSSETNNDHRNNLRQGRLIEAVDPVTKSVYTIGAGCGTYRMNDQQIIRIQSSNYGIDTYNHDDACIWKFYGENCGVSATCPCFDVPSSFKCFGDYLKISDFPIYDQKFCGEVSPNGVYRSATGHFFVRFKSDYKLAGKGFQCYVSCTAPGKADPVLPSRECFRNCVDVDMNGDPIMTDQTGEKCDIEFFSSMKKFNIQTNQTQKIKEQTVEWKPVSEQKKKT